MVKKGRITPIKVEPKRKAVFKWSFVVVVEVVEVGAELMEEVMAFVVVVVAAVVEVGVHADDDIDPEECVNMSIFFALEFTHETPHSI